MSAGAPEGSVSAVVQSHHDFAGESLVSGAARSGFADLPACDPCSHWSSPPPGCHTLAVAVVSASFLAERTDMRVLSVRNVVNPEMSGIQLLP